MAGDGVRLSKEQNRVRDAIMDWWKGKKSPFITVGGYAGTGKTTLIGYLRREIKREANIRVSFCSYTGRAARVLHEKLRGAGSLIEKDFCGTIHRLIYDPVFDLKGRVVGWTKTAKIRGDLVIVDEASMVNGPIWNDILSYEVPVIAVGDHGQLPPVEGTFNLMEDPDLKLEEIHRQAAGSPIIQLSMRARLEGEIPCGRFADGVEKVRRRDEETEARLNSLFSRYDLDTMVICGLNRTRVNLNRHIRSLLGFEGDDPRPGARVVCLRNNYLAKECRIFNGMLGTIVSIRKERKAKKGQACRAVIEMDGEDAPYVGRVNRDQFDNPKTLSYAGDPMRERGVDLFDWGYVLTVHKAQGSEARKVILFEQRTPLWAGEMWNRWLYTGVTRAQEELLIVG